MKLYLDTCCYSRPYDDQTQEKVHMEGEAILTIINRFKQNNNEIMGSQVLDIEIDRIDDIEKYENGYGDYTKEKYQQPDFTIENINMLLKNQ
jgi:hypothetical protein